MPSYQPVSFQSPGFDYGADISQIERRRAMAQMLQKEGMTPIQEQPVAPGQFAIRTSPFQAAAKMGQMLAAHRQQTKADEQQRQLAQTSQSNLASVLRNAQMAASGTPGTALSEDASGNVTPAQPAVAGDMSKAASLYMQHPATAQLGQGMMQQEMQQQQRQRLMAQIMGGGNSQPSAAAGGSAPAYGSPGFSPQGEQPKPGPFSGLPPQVTALMTSGDPELVKFGTTLLEANKGVAQRPGAPVVNPFTGAVIAQAPPSVPAGMQLTGGGPNGFSASMVPGFGGAQEQLRSIPDPSHAPITIKTSSGQDIQLQQPEYLQWQKTGQLPARFGGQATGQGGIPNLAQQAGAQNGGGFRVPGAPGLGIIGAGQSQQDVINQERQRAGGKAVDEQFAKDYVQFTQGGAQDATKQLAQLQDVSKALKVPGSGLTGTVVGNLPSQVKAVTHPESVAMQERVEEVVQRSLRAVLGAQFTEKEGERLIARAYNPRLSPQENAVRVDRLFTQLNQAYQQKQAAAKHFERHGTLEGWRGKLPSISDFDPDAGGAADPLGIRK